LTIVYRENERDSVLEQTLTSQDAIVRSKKLKTNSRVSQTTRKPNGAEPVQFSQSQGTDKRLNKNCGR